MSAELPLSLKGSDPPCFLSLGFTVSVVCLNKGYRKITHEEASLCDYQTDRQKACVSK